MKAVIKYPSSISTKPFLIARSNQYKAEEGRIGVFGISNQTACCGVLSFHFHPHTSEKTPKLQSINTKEDSKRYKALGNYLARMST